MFCHIGLSDFCLESKQIDFTLALQIMVDPPLQLMTFKLTIVYYICISKISRDILSQTFNLSLGIQSPPENGNGTQRLCVSEVIEHPSHYLRI